MELNEFEKNESIKNKAFSNKPYKVDNICVYTPTLNEIFDLDFEYKTYEYYLNLLTLEPKNSIGDIKNISMEEKKTLENLKTLDILISHIIESRNNIENNGKTELDILNALEFFLCKNDEQIHLMLSNNMAFFYIGDVEENRLIHRDNFEEIKKVIRVQNNVTESKPKYNPANKKANEFIEKLNKIKAKKQAENLKNQLTLHDMVSILSSKSNNLNILDIWNLNIYQFYDQLNRLPINENYDIQKYLLGNAYAGESIDFEKNNYFVKIKTQ